MSFSSHTALAVVLIAAPVTTAATQTSALFRQADEAARYPDFVEFQARLMKTVERRDVAALLRVVDPDIQIAFGDTRKLLAFKREWSLDNTVQTLWQELRAVRWLGGRWQDDGTFAAPYV